MNEVEYFDLSGVVGDQKNGFLKEKIQYTNHKVGGKLLGLSLVFSPGKGFFKTLKDLVKYSFGIKRVDHRDFPNEEGLSKEKVTLSTHSSTHLDAPFHFGSKSEGFPAKTIDQIPLDWCFGDGILLDFSDLDSVKRDEITVGHVLSKIEEVDVDLSPGMIVLIKTSPKKRAKALGMSREATEYFIDNGIKILGIDTFGFDRPFNDMLEDYLDTKDSKNLWPSHFLGREKEYCHLENLELEEFSLVKGFKVSCFPIKIQGASAGWTRVVAMKNKVNV